MVNIDSELATSKKIMKFIMAGVFLTKKIIIAMVGKYIFFSLINVKISRS
jgi:hypothetical protein